MPTLLLLMLLLVSFGNCLVKRGNPWERVEDLLNPVQKLVPILDPGADTVILCGGVGTEVSSACNSQEPSKSTNTVLGALVTPVSAYSAIAVSPFVYLCGGTATLSFEGATNVCQGLDMRDGSQASVSARLAVERSAQSSAINDAGDTLLMCGGLARTGIPLSDCESYMPARDEMTRVAKEMSIPRYGFSMTNIGRDRFIICGGYDAIGNPSCRELDVCVRV
jgi:hypothetical protein